MDLKCWMNPCDWEDFHRPCWCSFPWAACMLWASSLQRNGNNHLALPHGRATEGAQVRQFLQDSRNGSSLSMEPARQHLPLAQGIDEPALMPVTYRPGGGFSRIFLGAKAIPSIECAAGDHIHGKRQHDANVSEATSWISLCVCEEMALLRSPENLGQNTDQAPGVPSSPQIHSLCSVSSLSFIAVAPLWIPLQKFHSHWSMSGCYLDIPTKYIGIYLHIPVTYIDIPPTLQAGETLIRELSITQSLSLAPFRVDTAQITLPGWTCSPAGLVLSWSLYDSNPSSQECCPWEEVWRLCGLVCAFCSMGFLFFLTSMTSHQYRGFPYHCFLSLSGLAFLLGNCHLPS